MTTGPNLLLLSEMNLRRYPARSGDSLQAWDAADELVVEHATTLGLAGKKILVVGDTYGAISCALAEYSPSSYTDSFLAAEGIAMNSGGRLRATSRFEELIGPYDLVLLRVPKNLSFLEDTLARLGAIVRPGTPLVAAYMIKHQANSAFDLIAKYFGETRTSLAKKKARLIFAEFSREPVASPYPLSLSVAGFEKPFVNHSNVFSREKLDLGTRFFIEHLPRGDFRTILDLGCGNGIVGIAAKLRNPGANLVFTDESRMAVLSAEANHLAFFPGASAEFHWTNSFEKGASGSVDLALCNPPFHQGNTVGDFVAREMFRDAHRVLSPGGTLRVIGNSHLHYPEILRRLFGDAKIVAKNPKFTVVETRKI